MSAQSKSHSIEMCVPPDNRQQTKSIQQQLNKFVDPLYIYIAIFYNCFLLYFFFSLCIYFMATLYSNKIDKVKRSLARPRIQIPWCKCSICCCLNENERHFTVRYELHADICAQSLVFCIVWANLGEAPFLA